MYDNEPNFEKHEYVQMIIDMLNQMWIPGKLDLQKWVYTHPYAKGYEKNIIAFLEARKKGREQAEEKVKDVLSYIVNVDGFANVMYYIYDHLNNRNVWICEGEYHELDCNNGTFRKDTKRSSAAARKNGIYPAHCCKWKYIRSEHSYPPGEVNKIFRDHDKKPSQEELQKQIELMEMDQVLTGGKSSAYAPKKKSTFVVIWNAIAEKFAKDPDIGVKDKSKERLLKVVADGRSGRESAEYQRQKEFMEKCPAGNEDKAQETDNIPEVSEKSVTKKTVYPDTQHTPLLQWIVFFSCAIIIFFAPLIIFEKVQKFLHSDEQILKQNATTVTREPQHQRVHKQIDPNAQATGIEIWLERIDLQESEMKIFLTWKNTSGIKKTVQVGRETKLTCGEVTYLPKRIQQRFLKGIELNPKGVIQIAMIFPEVYASECHMIFFLEDGYGRKIATKLRDGE